MGSGILTFLPSVKAKIALFVGSLALTPDWLFISPKLPESNEN